MNDNTDCTELRALLERAGWITELNLETEAHVTMELTPLGQERADALARIYKPVADNLADKSKPRPSVVALFWMGFKARGILKQLTPSGLDRANGKAKPYASAVALGLMARGILKPLQPPGLSPAMIQQVIGWGLTYGRA